MPNAKRQMPIAAVSISQELGEFCSRYCDLLAAGEILHRELIGLHFVFAHDDDEPRARFFRQLE